MTIKIYTCYHKPYVLPDSTVVSPIHVGAEKSNHIMLMQPDNEGDNISVKNPHYCELTAVYWIWKNATADIVGLFHYRRFFNFANNDTDVSILKKRAFDQYGITEQNVEKILSEYDIILPQKCNTFKETLYDFYKRYHHIGDLDKVIEIIQQKYPEMSETTEHILKHNSEGYFANLMIARKELFDEYAKWLFDILFELEAQIQQDVINRDSYQQRVYGFLSERLLNVFVAYKQKTSNMKIFELPTIFVQNHPINEVKSSRFKNLIVGAGLSGAVLAHKIATELHEEVAIIDVKDHIAGNCYDYQNEDGIYVHQYGTHIFHTNSSEVWNYISQFTQWYPYMHKVKGYIDGQEVPIPFNLNSIHQVFPKSIAERLEKKLIKKFGYNTKISILELRQKKDKDLVFLADYVYEKVFLNYTLKQWGVKPEDIDSSVTGRVPIYISRDDRYFQDKYQGIPLNGYTEIVKKMLDNPLIKVYLKTDFKEIQSEFTYERLFYTGPIDEFFDYELGKLPYRSLKFDFLRFDRPFFQSEAVINYPNNYDFTRIGEYKYFLDTQSDATVVSYEYPQKFVQGINERYYPIIKEDNLHLYKAYLEKANQLKNVYFLGRLGDYKYYNMDAAIERALNLFYSLK